LIALRLRAAAGWLIVLVLVGGWSVFLRPPALGGATSYVFVSGDSMLPTFRPGDLVLVRKAARYHVGEVVAYRVRPGDHQVIHRIVGTTAGGRFVLRGDNRDAQDPWHPTTADILGRREARLPKLGVLLVQLAVHPVALALLVALLVFAAVVTGDNA
jgi:signal peptidase I